MKNNDNIQQEQSPSARAVHHRGQNAAVAPEKPAAPTRSSGASLATSGTTIASFFVRPQTTPAAPAPQAPAASLGEPATATRATPATTAIPAPATVSAVPAMLSPPCYHPPLVNERLEAPKGANQRGLRYHPPCYHPIGSCPKASKCANCRGLRYHPPCFHSPAAGVGVRRVPNITHCTAITPRRYHPPLETTPRW